MIIRKYLLKEVIPQFFTVLIVFCTIIVVSQLVRLSNVLVTFGLTLENVFLPFLYILMPFMPIVLPIAFMFAVLLSFSRLTMDGEYTALLAAGFSLKQILVPIMLLSFLVYGAGLFCAVNLEAWGRREFVQFIYRKTQTELDNLIRFKLQPGVFVNDFLDYVMYAEKIAKNRIYYKNVMISSRADSKDGDFMIFAPRAEIQGSVEEGDLTMTLFNGMSYAYKLGEENTSVLQFKSAQIDLLRIFHEKILGEDSATDDYRSYRAGELYQYIDKLRKDPKSDKKLYARAYFLWHSRIANPFIVIAFALLGCVLGIQEQRQQKSSSYIASVVTIIFCFVVMVVFRWFSEQGHIHPILAAWIPQISLLFFSLFWVWQKDRLPLGERVFARENMPFRFKKKSIP